MAGARRLSGITAVAVALGACLALAAARPPLARAAAGSTTPTSGHSFTKTSQMVTSAKRAGAPIQLDTDLYVPDNATAATPQPAVIYANGFGGAKDDATGSAVGPWLASHGYVVLAYSSSGFGRSGGCIELDSPDYDVKDVEALIDFLATRPVVQLDGPGDPRVGMVGGSYGGGIQLMTAENDPRLDVITPFRTWDDLEYALSPQHLGGGTPLQASSGVGVLKYLWATLFFANGITQPLQQRGGCGPATGNLCPGFDPQVCQVYATAVAGGRLDPGGVALLQRSSPSSHLDQLRIPTLLGQGQSDTLFNLDESVATYRSLRARGVPTRLVWHFGGHGYDDQPGEGDIFGNDQSSPDQKYLPQQVLAWLDHHLRQSPSVKTGPQFTYFRDWVSYDPNGSAAPAYGSARDLPSATQSFALSGSNALVPAGAPVAAGSATLLNPPNAGICAALPQATVDPACSFTEFSNFQQPGATLPGGAPSPYPGTPPSDPPGTVVSFVSAPFAQDTVSAGIPTAHLHLSHASALQDAVLFGKVYDVAPGGAATLVHRLIAPLRVTGTSAAVDLYLDGIVHRFAAGHAVRFDLAATDATSLNNRLADSITVSTGGADPSTFTLPVGG